MEGAVQSAATPRPGDRTAGGKLESMCFVFGDMDVVGIVDFPDHASAVATSGTINGSGTTTIKPTRSSLWKRSTWPPRRRPSICLPASEHEASFMLPIPRMHQRGKFRRVRGSLRLRRKARLAWSAIPSGRRAKGARVEDGLNGDDLLFLDLIPRGHEHRGSGRLQVV
jgi:GYD domain